MPFRGSCFCLISNSVCQDWSEDFRFLKTLVQVTENRIVRNISEAFDHEQVKPDSIIMGESVRVVAGPSITQGFSLGRAHKERRGTKDEGGVETVVQMVQREFDEILADEWGSCQAPCREAEVPSRSHVFKSEICHWCFTQLADDLKRWKTECSHEDWIWIYRQNYNPYTNILWHICSI